MYFLIDYENVNYAGLEGTEFLEKGDTISFFYSDKCDKIISYRMKDIEKSGCAFEICKLKNVRKNGLDFYIASQVGEIFAMDRNAKIVIISADNGFQAVLDYWRPRLPVQNQLVKSKSIAKSLICVNGEGARKLLVNENMGVLELQAVFAKYEERNRIVAGITDLFVGTDYESLISQIVDIVLSSDKPKILYLTSLKSFGRKNGTEVYRKIKNSAISSLGCGMLAQLFVFLNVVNSADRINMGNIMLLIPGLAMVNALKDMFLGEMLSGLLRLTQAMIQALAVALGFAVCMFVL